MTQWHLEPKFANLKSAIRVLGREIANAKVSHERGNGAAVSAMLAQTLRTVAAEMNATADALEE